MKKIFTLIACAFVALCASAATSSVGSADNSSTWWTAFSETYEVKEGQTAHISFKNYSSKGQTWNNWDLVLANGTGHSTQDRADYAEYAVYRVDNYGWGTYYDGSSLKSAYNWDTFKDDMDGSDVTMEVYNTDGIIYCEAVIRTSAGKIYNYSFNTTNTNTKDFYFFLTTELGHITDLNVTVGTVQGTYIAKAVSGYPCANTSLVEYDNCVLVKAFDGTEGNDLVFTWEGDYWTTCNGVATPTVYYFNNGTYTKATIKASTVGYTTGSNFYVTITAYTSDSDPGTSTYLYWTLSQPIEVGNVTETKNVTYTDYSDTYPCYTTDVIVKDYKTTVDYTDKGYMIIRNWLQSDGYDVILTPTSDGYFSAVNGASGMSASADYASGKTGWIYLGSYSWYTSKWIYLNCYLNGGYASCYYKFDTASGINAANVAPANAGKFVENGRVVIVRNGKKYTAAGALLK